MCGHRTPWHPSSEPGTALRTPAPKGLLPRFGALASTAVGGSLRWRRVRQIGSECLIMPNACAHTLPKRRWPRSQPRCRRSVKPSAGPTLIRTRHLPFCRRGKAAAIKTTPSAATQGLKALQALLSLRIASHLEMRGIVPQRKRSTQKPDQPTHQNSRFWMSATGWAIIVGGVPNGGSARDYQGPIASSAA